LTKNFGDGARNDGLLLRLDELRAPFRCGTGEKSNSIDGIMSV
jgi:hypothetical protein